MFLCEAEMPQILIGNALKFGTKIKVMGPNHE